MYRRDGGVWGQHNANVSTRKMVVSGSSDMNVNIACVCVCVREQIKKTQDEPQWIVAQRLLSALTIPGFT